MVGFARRFRPTYAEANVGHPSQIQLGVFVGARCGLARFVLVR
jgi:hypothetical protein